MLLAVAFAWPADVAAPVAPVDAPAVPAGDEKTVDGRFWGHGHGHHHHHHHGGWNNYGGYGGGYYGGLWREGQKTPEGAAAAVPPAAVPAAAAPAPASDKVNFQ